MGSARWLRSPWSRLYPRGVVAAALAVLATGCVIGPPRGLQTEEPTAVASTPAPAAAASPAGPAPRAAAPSPVAKPSPVSKPAPAAAPVGSPITLPAEVVVVANREDRSLSVVDPAEPRVLATISLSRPPGAVTLSSDGRFAYATDASPDGRSVLVADLGQARQVGEIPVGAQPAGIAAPQSGGPLVVTSRGDGTVTTFDQQARAPQPGVQAGRAPAGVTLAGVRGRLLALVAIEGDGSLALFDVGSRQVTQTVQVGGRPTAVAVSVDSTRAYVLDADGGRVVAVDLQEPRVLGTFQVGARLTGLDTAADGRTLLVTADDPNSALYRVDLATQQVAGSTGPGAGALAVMASPRSTRAYVTTTDGRLHMWDTAAERVVGTVAVGRQPGSVAVRSTVAPAPAPSPGVSTSPVPAPSPRVVGSPAPAVKPASPSPATRP